VGVRLRILPLEMSSGELSPGTGFEVGFECSGFLFGTKADCGLDLPGPVFGSMGHTAFIVLLQAGVKVGGTAGVMVIRIAVTDQNVDIIPFGWHAGLRSRSTAIGFRIVSLVQN